MDCEASSHVSLGAALLGVLSHLTIFIRGEWHMQGRAIITTYSFLTIALLCAEYCRVNDFSSAIRAVWHVTGSYAAGLFSSIIIYRKYFHRLRHFPGPPLAAITKLWHVWKVLDGKNHQLRPARQPISVSSNATFYLGAYGRIAKRQTRP